MASGSTALSRRIPCDSNYSLLKVISKRIPFELNAYDEPFPEERGPLQEDSVFKDLKTFAARADKKLCDVIHSLESILQDETEELMGEEQTDSQGDETMDSQDEGDDDEDFEEEQSNAELAGIEFFSLIFKLWLQRVGLTRLEDYGRYSSFQDFEHAIYNAQEAINRYRNFICKEYYNQHELTQSDYVRSVEETLTKVVKEKEKSGFEMMDEDITLLNRPTVQVCSLLGLKLDFLDRLQTIPEHHLQHCSVRDWIAIFLQNNITSVSSETKTSLTIELLDSIGFDPLSTAVETIMARSSKGNTQNHIEACEWAEIFIQDELKYNPLLSPRVLQFPFESNLRDAWFQLSFDENESNLNQCQVNIMNFVTKASHASADISSKLNGFLPQDERSTTLFHGTDHHSASDILRRGIDLCAGRQNRDFSCRSGFYLTKNMDEALNWAQCTTAKPAILVFQVTQQHLDGAKILSLNTDGERWGEVVASFRSGRIKAKTRENLSAYDLIEGPQATVKRDATSGELVLEKKPSSYQMCLISEDFAENFEKTLHSILFFYISST